MKIVCKLFPVFLLPPLLLGIGLYLCAQKPAFGLSHITSSLVLEKTWKTKPPPEEIYTLLAQPFSYLGAGSQCYAFLSQDGKTVLKFFRMKNFSPKPWYFFFPAIGKLKTVRDKKIGLQKERLEQLFLAYQLAYDELKEESGLIYLHLDKTQDALPCTIFDKEGKKHTVDLSKLEFVVQKRADILLKDHLFNLLRAGKHKEIEQVKRILFTQILSREKKGIHDRDEGLENNYGFSQGVLFQVDPGRLGRSKEAPPKNLAQLEARFNKMLTNCSHQEGVCPK